MQGESLKCPSCREPLETIREDGFVIIQCMCCQYTKVLVTTSFWPPPATSLSESGEKDSGAPDAERGEDNEPDTLPVDWQSPTD